MTDLVYLFAKPGESRVGTWRTALVKMGDPSVFERNQIFSFEDYCQNYDLLLGFPLSGPSQ
jgi:hypothetical protein